MNTDISINPTSQNKEASEEAKPWHLYLHNDPHNTFWHVMRALCEDAKMAQIPAEQATMIAHHNGKAHIKMGPPEELVIIQQALENRNLDVELRKTPYA